MSETPDSGLVPILGHRVPRRISSPELEAAALREGAALVPAPWERRLDVIGSDAASFLHALLTQHIRGLAVGASVPAALATRKGHLVADLTVFRATETGFQIRLPEFTADAVVDILTRHQIMEDVRFEWGYPDPDAFLLVGREARTVRLSAEESLRGDEATLSSDSGHPLRPSTLPIHELGPGDVVLFFGSADRERVRKHCLDAGAVPVGWDAFDRRRIECGRAWFGIDADAERLVPEPGFDDRIHYDKGCYLGQEPLARLHFRGRPNWGLVRVRGEVDAPLVAGASLLDGSGSRVGWVTSSSVGSGGLVGLGYLHRRFRETDVDSVQVDGGPVLSWQSLPD